MNLTPFLQQTMAHYEAGSLRVAVAVAMLPTLSDALGMSIEELIGVEPAKAARRTPHKREPVPRIQQQLEAVRALPPSSASSGRCWSRC